MSMCAPMIEFEFIDNKHLFDDIFNLKMLRHFKINTVSSFLRFLDYACSDH